MRVCLVCPSKGFLSWQFIITRAACQNGDNEAPRSKLRGIKSEFAEANPPSLFKLRRVRPAIFSRDGAFSKGRSSLKQAAEYSGEGE